MNGATVPSYGSPAFPAMVPILSTQIPDRQVQSPNASSTGSNGSPPSIHSVKLFIPPPSQSASAIGLVGLAITKSHMSMPLSSALMQSSLGSSGSSPDIHSKILLTPPPSQSARAIGPVGFAKIIAHKSTPATIALLQSSAGSNGSSPVWHSVILLMPPPSQSAKASGLEGLANIKAHKSRPDSSALAQSSAGSSGSSPVAHSVALSTPPPSQSSVASGWTGFAVIRLHMITFSSTAASQSSPGARGSVPASHSVEFIIPPPSQSSILSIAVELLARMTHKSSPANSTAIHSSV